jgi:AP-1 complex subunit gamma-1
MPPPEIKQTVLGTVSEAKPVGSTRTDKDALLDLMGDEMPVASGGASASAGASTQQSTQDLLADIFGASDMGGAPAPAAAPAGQPAQKAKSSVNDILGLFGDSGSTPVAPAAAPAAAASASSAFGLDLLGGLDGSSSSPAPTQAATAPAPAAAPAAPAASSAKAHTVYEKNGLKITLTPTTNPARPEIVNITARFTATGGNVSGVNFQAAVPKTHKLQMQAISNSDVVPGATETQALRVMVPNSAPVRLRLRIAFTVNGQNIQDQTDWAQPSA